MRKDEEAFRVVLQSDAIAAFVWLDVGTVPGRFSSNGFLMVDRNITVSFYPWRETDVTELSESLFVTTLRDVY